MTKVKQKVIREQSPNDFESELQAHLDEGWELVPGSMMASYEPEGTYGVFLCVVRKEE